MADRDGEAVEGAHRDCRGGRLRDGLPPETTSLSVSHRYGRRPSGAGR